jgi:hypothetical protein
MFNGPQDAVQPVAPLTQRRPCRASVTMSGSAPWPTGLFSSAVISRNESPTGSDGTISLQNRAQLRGSVFSFRMAK